jgi:hypothetical protein
MQTGGGEWGTVHCCSSTKDDCFIPHPYLLAPYAVQTFTSTFGNPNTSDKNNGRPHVNSITRIFRRFPYFRDLYRSKLVSRFAVINWIAGQQA